MAVKGSYSETEVKKKEKIEEISGNLKLDNADEKLMHSVLDNDKETIDDGKLINESINQGLLSFTPDLMFENMVRNYSLAEHIYGPSLLRMISGYSSDYISKNIKIPEFQKELKRSLQNNFDKLNKKGLVDQSGFTKKAISLASLILYVEELDNIAPKGFLGEKLHKKSFMYGSRENIKSYAKGDRYKDIAVRNSIKTSLRRSHSNIDVADLRSFERKSKGSIYIIYAVDASGSMKGKKIETAKKAGIALAYKAISARDKVGLLIFGSEIKSEVEPTYDFSRLLSELTKARASKQTDMASTIKKSISMFPKDNVTKHVILLTDALPTTGKEPERETLEAASLARSNGITISLVGINLDKHAAHFADELVKIGNGRLYTVKHLEDIDKIVLEDYTAVVSQ